MSKLGATALLLYAATSVAATAAFADGTHGSWASRLGEERCWAFTLPVSATPSPERGTAYLSIQNHKPEGIRGSIAVVSGLPDSAAGEVSLSVDGKSFDMLPFGEAAFARTGAPEAALIAAMRSGREMTVTWALPSGGKVEDRYSMDGFTAAKADIDKCR